MFELNEIVYIMKVINMIKCNINVLVSTNTVYLQITIHVKIVHAVHTLSCLNLSFIYKQCIVLT